MSGRGSLAGDGVASALRGLEHRRYLDDMVDDYVTWREACATVAAAYGNWKEAGRRDQKSAVSEYIAALNCEEEAATAYRFSVERVASSEVCARR